METARGRIAAAAIILAIAAYPAWATTREAATWAMLRAADFHPEKDGQSRIWQAGEIAAGNRRFEVWRYRWLEDVAHMAGSVRHERNWLLILEDRDGKRSFLGGYTTDNSPIRVSGRTIEFDYARADTSVVPGVRGLPQHEAVRNLRYQIVFGDDGPPSRVLLLDGYHRFDPASHHMGAWRVLSDGHFSGATDADARIWQSGVLTAGGRKYEIWGYAWEEDPRAWNDNPGDRKHKGYKVLVFERTAKGLSYLGNYERDNAAFHVEGRAIKFDPPKSGKPPGYLSDDPGEGAMFDDKGPPAEARINWITRPFVR